MRLIDILPSYEIRIFDNPPMLSSDDQKYYFKMDETIRGLLKGIKEEHNKIGLLLQYGYFKASGKFYMQTIFKSTDVKFATRAIGGTICKDFAIKYINRTRQRHKLLILESCGHREFTCAEKLFKTTVENLVAQQMHPRKLFYLLVEELRNRNIEIPSYDRITKIITEKFSIFEKTILRSIANIITPNQQEALDHLISTTGEYYQRPLITRLKTINQSLRPGQIKQGMRNFLIIKKLFQEVRSVIEILDLSLDATKYYAQWVVKAKVTQITDITQPHKRYLYLVAFIDHYHKIWQDALTDMLLKNIQQQLNKADKRLDNVIKERITDKNKWTNSVLSGFDNTRSTVDAVRKTLHDTVLNNDQKIKKLYQLVPKENKNLLLNKAVSDAKKLEEQLGDERGQIDQLDILSALSRKLQNRASDTIKHLRFEKSNENESLYSALMYYQSEKNITAAAPDEFLADHERNAVHRNGEFNVSLYKAILFCSVANAIKSGQLSLMYSYRYLTIDSYLIDEDDWTKNKHIYTASLDLPKNIEQLLSTLRKVLDNQYISVNQRIINKDNKYVAVKKAGTYSIYTPAVSKPDYDAISTIIGKDKYIPILQMMAETNNLSKFTSDFKHHKIKASKAKPDDEIFYAGIFALGSNIGIHKLASTALGINYNTLSNSVNWYFSLENLHMANQSLVDVITKLWLPDKFKRENNILHTSSDGQKQSVSVESLNANYSYKYHGNGKGVNVYRFIDERGILFYTNVFSSSERDAAYVIDGLLHNEVIQSDMHSTDTHGYTEMIFAVSNLIGVTFAPRIKDVTSLNLVSFSNIKSMLANDNYPVKPAYYVKEDRIIKNWDNILRLVTTIMLRKHRASVILKRLSAYTNQHPLQEALKEFGKIIKSIFVLRYIDDVTLRQIIEKQLNKGELANKFATAISFAGAEVTQAYRDDQEISAMCKTIIQNIIILWNYIELTKIIMRLDNTSRQAILENITNASILTWQHINLHGIYDFSNLLSANDQDYSLSEVINFKVA
jgi:TnpA family transposase|tara:strand:+ start:1007 stop:4051 length:3045 start_codon:yes stop_codon:yes gene_type:complete